MKDSDAFLRSVGTESSVKVPDKGNKKPPKFVAPKTNIPPDSETKDRRVHIKEDPKFKRFSDFLTELYEQNKSFENQFEDFVQFACVELEIDQPPLIILESEKQKAIFNRSFGGYSPSTKSITTNIAERHRADIFRTIAHELVHYKQDLNDMLDENSGETGSDIENEANALAGVIMRKYAQRNPALFESVEEAYFT